MAAGSLIKAFCEEVTCSVCLEFFKEPVILDCGHNFCQACLTECWAKTDTGASCPQCRELVQQKNLRPNRQLVTIVELVKKLQVGKGAEGKWGRCPQYPEGLKWFCHNDQDLNGEECDRSTRHRNHGVLSLEKTFLEYKNKIKAQLRWLEQETEELKEEKKVKDERIQKFLMQLESETQKTKSAFQTMRDYLEQQERLRLSQLEKMKGEIEMRVTLNQARFSKEISDLSRLITELEGKVQQPETVDMQDPKTTLSRHEKTPERQLVDLPPILEHKLRIYSEQTLVLQNTLQEHEESLTTTLAGALTKVNVTLDPKTAHPDLVLTPDLKSVTGKKNMQTLPNNPERFDTLKGVLGREQFTSGRHWWEVDMGSTKSLWAVGVARESAERKGKVTINPDEGFWILQTERRIDHGRYYWQLNALTSSRSVNVPINIPPKIRVVLDYEEGLVGFFSAAGNEMLYTFHSTSFSGETLRPYFSTEEGYTLKC